MRSRQYASRQEAITLDKSQGSRALGPHSTVGVLCDRRDQSYRAFVSSAFVRPKENFVMFSGRANPACCWRVDRRNAGLKKWVFSACLNTGRNPRDRVSVDPMVGFRMSRCGRCVKSHAQLDEVFVRVVLQWCWACLFSAASNRR